MKRSSPLLALGIVLVFFGGFFSHVLYQRWNPSSPAPGNDHAAVSVGQEVPPGQAHAVSFAPLSPVPAESDHPLFLARDVEKIRALSGRMARIRGRIFRVGHSAKSNTHFLNFGPSRDALTAVIFASALELFQKSQLPPKSLAGKEVEISGTIKDDPQYGLEMILENPQQIKILD